jgi:osmotically-inducible protein OsmY
MAVSPEPTDGPTDPAAPEATPLVGAVRSALEHTGHGWLRLVAVTAEDGAIVLRGRVPSFYLKQMALTAALGVPGVGLVRNELRVEGGGR